jgi:hypothetical protein
LGNVFDQFDETSGTAAAPAEQGGNVFDQFDEAAPTTDPQRRRTIELAKERAAKDPKNRNMPGPDGYSADNPPYKDGAYANRKQPARGEPSAPGVFDYAAEGLQSFGRGAVSTAGSMVKGAAVALAANEQEVDAIEGGLKNLRAMPVEQAEAFRQSIRNSSLNPAAKVAYESALRARWAGDEAKAESYLTAARKLAVPGPASESELYQAGQGVQDQARKDFPQDPRFQDSWTSAIGEGLGSTTAFLPAAGAGPLGVAVTGALASGEQGYDEAKRDIATSTRDDRAGLFNAGLGTAAENVARKAGQVSMAPGLSEAVPIEILLDQTFGRIPFFKTPAGATLLKKSQATLYRIGAQMLTEGGQEAFQQWANNVINQYMVDPSQQSLDGVAENAAVGAIVGGGMQTVSEGVGAATGTTPQASSQPPNPSSQGPNPSSGTPQTPVSGKGDRIEPQMFRDAQRQPAPPPAGNDQQMTGGDAQNAATRPMHSNGYPQADDAAYLAGSGYTPEQIAEMHPEERAKEAAAAREVGVQPVAPPPPAPGTAPLAPGFGAAQPVQQQAEPAPAPASPESNPFDQFDAEPAPLMPARDEMRPPHSPAPMAPRAPQIPHAEADKAFSTLFASKAPITPEALAQQSGMPQRDAVKAVQRAALRGSIIQTRTGKWIRAPRRVKPISALEFIASIGGIQDPTGELKGMDLPKMGPYGPVIRKSGLHPDKVREQLIDSGYMSDMGRTGDGQQTTTVNDVYDLIDREMRGQKAYQPQDQAKADALAVQAKNDALPPDYVPVHHIARRFGLQTWDKVKTALDTHGLDEGNWSAQELSDAARMVNEGQDPEDALVAAAVKFVEDNSDPETEFPEVREWMRAKDKDAIKILGEAPPFPDVEPSNVRQERPDGKGESRATALEKGERPRVEEAVRRPREKAPVSRQDGGKGQDRGAAEAAILEREPPKRANTQTKGFRKWHAGSKVIDEKGEARVVYHGTPAGDFSSFDTYASNYGLMGQGGYFTEDPSVASEYTSKGAAKMERRGETPAQTVYPVHLSIKNPLDMNAAPDVEAWTKAFSDYVTVEDFAETKTNEDAYRVIEDALSYESLPMYEGAEIMQGGIRAMGHDGITHIGGQYVRKDGKEHRVWIAFDPEQIKSIHNAGTFDPNKAEMLSSRADPSLSPRSFAIPRDAKITTVSTTISALTQHPDYVAAKAGDLAATARLIPDVVTQEFLREARVAFGKDAVFLPVHAEEASGRNKIPAGFANYLQINIGGAVDNDIVQLSKAFHTGASPIERLMSRPLFDGKVRKGARYVIVDDVTVLGGTIAELSDYIQRGGGTVVGVATIANQSRNGVRGLTAALPAQVRDIERRFGDEIRTELGIAPEGLTFDEAFYLRNFRDADALRSRLAAARLEREQRLLSKGIRQEKLNAEARRRLDRVTPNRLRYSITQKQARELAAHIQQTAERILGRHLVGVEVRRTLEAEFSAAEDAVFDPNTGLIWVALQGLQDPKTSIRHEAIHALRNAGVFTAQEWAALSRMAQTRWIEQFNIRRRYEQLYRERFALNDAQIEELLAEEAIAEAFAEHLAKSPQDESLPGRIFTRLRRFLEALRNMLAGRGFTSVDQIIRGVDEGQFGRRNAGAGQGRDFLLYGRQGSQRLRVTDSEEFRRWFGDSKVVDEQGAPLVVYHATDYEFDAFDTTRTKGSDEFTGDNWFGQGAYFSPSESDLLEHVGVSTEDKRIIAAYVSIENPYRWQFGSEDKIIPDLKAAGIDIEKEFDGYVLVRRGPEKFTAWAKSQGYDGVVVTGKDGRISEIVAFNPTSIKSIHNRGTFDGSNPNILSSRGYLKPPKNAAPGSFDEPHDERVLRALFDSTDTLLNRIRRAGKAAGIEFVRKLQDREVDLLRTQKAIERANGPIIEPQDAYLASSLYPGRVAQRDRTIVEEVVKPLIEDIANRGLTVEQVDEFARAQHAFERNAYIATIHKPGTQFNMAATNPALVGGSGLSNDQANAIIQRYRSEGKYADVKAMADRVVKMGRDRLDALLAEGLIEQETHDTLTRRYKHYVPLRGEDDATSETHPDAPRSGRRYDVRGRKSAKRSVDRHSPIHRSPIQSCRPERPTFESRRTASASVS